MANELSTLGVKLSYAVETSASTKPSAFTQISGIKSISSLNEQPNQLDCTPLEETGYRRYIPGLKDTGGVVTVTANMNDVFQTAWESMCSAVATAKESNLATWYEINIPGMTDKFYFTGEPTELGLNAVEVDSVFEIDAYITPNVIKGWM